MKNAILLKTPSLQAIARKPWSTVHRAHAGMPTNQTSTHAQKWFEALYSHDFYAGRSLSSGGLAGICAENCVFFIFVDTAALWMAAVKMTFELSLVKETLNFVHVKCQRFAQSSEFLCSFWKSSWHAFTCVFCITFAWHCLFTIFANYIWFFLLKFSISFCNYFCLNFWMTMPECFALHSRLC